MSPSLKGFFITYNSLFIILIYSCKKIGSKNFLLVKYTYLCLPKKWGCFGITFILRKRDLLKNAEVAQLVEQLICNQ
jgi:hypothetical protein